MSAVAEYVDAQATEIAGLVDDGASTVLIDGARGSGRSMVLERTAQVLGAAGLRPVLVTPPARHVDTPSVAMLDCAVGLAEQDLLDDELTAWTSDGGTWRTKREQLRAWLSMASAEENGFVLLCDDTRQWSQPETDSSAGHAETAADLLLREASCTRVVAGRAGDVPASVVSVDLRLATPRVLEDAARWGLLADVLNELRALGLPLADRSPTELGFLVAHGALFGSSSILDWWSSDATPERAADRLAAAVARTQWLRPLWNAWLTVAVPRRDVPIGWVQPVLDGVPEGVQRDVLTKCLVFGEDILRVAREARAAASRHANGGFAERVDRRESRRFLTLYAQAFEQAAEEHKPATLLHGAEALYMASRLGDTSLIGQAYPRFSDQLSAIGTQALERNDVTTAVEAFGMAVETDDEDAFAHHYLGFALDIDAQEPVRAEAEYRRALALDGTHAAWRARLVSLLIVRARDDDARAAWEEARVALAAQDGSGSLDLYAKLHLPVAADLLRRNRLPFAREVLDDIPEWARRQLLADSGLRLRLLVLSEAERWGSYVPARRATEQWWSAGPELLELRLPDGRNLRQWMAAHISEIVADEAHMQVAMVADTGRPETGTLTLSLDELQRLATDVDRAADIRQDDFLEIGFYGDDEAADPVVRILRREDWSVGLETHLDPARYLRRRGWA